MRKLSIDIGHSYGWWRFQRHPEMWEKPENDRACWTPHWSLYLGPVEIRWLEYRYAEPKRPRQKKRRKK